MEGSTVAKEILVDLQERYVKVRKLLDECSKLDPESEPYKSKYAAQDLLKEMQIKLVNALDDKLTEEQENLTTAMLAVVWLNLGIISVDTEELSAGEEQLTNCTDILIGRELKPECILPMASALNQLGILWSQRDQLAKSKVFLERAERLYKDYTALASATPVGMATLFDVKDDEEPDPGEVLEKLHTLTLYYLAQVYGSLGDHLKSAVYCHMTLRRQLEHKDLDCVDWALNAATLSQFFMEKGGFEQARHHLAAASHVLQKYEEELKSLENIENEETMGAKWENLKHRSADVARCWAKYGILLLCASREHLMQQAENEESDRLTTAMSRMELDPKSEITEECLENLRFPSLEKDIELVASQVTSKYLLDFNDARQVFLNSQSWLEEAKKYYTLESHASDYVQVVQDTSQAYKYLCFFEENDDNKAKMHKRRIDLFENVVRELNPRYYQAACRQIWVELGETYSDILDIKVDRLRASDERPAPHALNKINKLAQNAIKNFQKFIDSFKDSDTTDGPVRFPEELVRPALCAYFHLGRLYNKIITPDKKAQLENITKSMNACKFLVEYCETDEKAMELMKIELSVCKDLVSLLPLKIDKLTRELN